MKIFFDAVSFFIYLRSWNSPLYETNSATVYLLIVDFLVKNKNIEIFKELYQIIADTLDKRDLKGMRMMYTDNNEMARGLSPNKLSELNQILKKKFSFDLDKDHDKVSNKINLIVQRGHLKNDDEFRLLFSRVDEIYADDGKEKEVETLENLMSDYEKSKAAKMLKKRTYKIYIFY